MDNIAKNLFLMVQRVWINPEDVAKPQFSIHNNERLNINTRVYSTHLIKNPIGS